MKNLKFVVSALVLVLALSMVSAMWPFDGGITGNVARGSTFKNTAACVDSDNGTFIGIQGVVKREGRFGTAYTPDRCTGPKKTLFFLLDNGSIDEIVGRNRIVEYYCDGKKRKSQEFISGKVRDENEKFIGGGICTTEDAPAGLFSGGKKVARWIKPEPFCLKIAEGQFRNHVGTTFKDHCENKNYITYSCSEDGKQVDEDSDRCTTRCDDAKGGCVGICTDETDANNSIFEYGSLKLDNRTIFDKCSQDGKGIVEYTCVGDKRERINVQSCGRNRVCETVEGKGAKCEELYAGAGSGVSEEDIAALVEEAVADAGIGDVFANCEITYDSSETKTCSEICGNLSKTCVFGNIYTGTISYTSEGGVDTPETDIWTLNVGCGFVPNDNDMIDTLTTSEIDVSCLCC